jgi:hypothetical protein
MHYIQVRIGGLPLNLATIGGQLGLTYKYWSCLKNKLHGYFCEKFGRYKKFGQLCLSIGYREMQSFMTLTTTYVAVLRMSNQGTLAEREGSVQLTSLH